MRLRTPTVREVVGSVGAVAFAVGVVAAFAPDRLPPAMLAVVREVEAAVEPWVVVLALSLTVFAYAAYRFWRAEDGDVERLVPEGDRERSVPDVDDAVVDFDPDRPGRAFDYAMARTVAQLEADPNADAWEADRVREDLETAAVVVLTGRGRETSAARTAVADGSWTDDPVAAAFLGGPDAPGVALRRRLYAWLFPARAFRGRVERVVEEIEHLASAEGREREGEDESAAAAGAAEDATGAPESPAGDSESPAGGSESPAGKADEGDVEATDQGASASGGEGVGS